MRGNKISFSHKNRLILFTKINRQNEEKHTKLEFCSTAIAFSKEIKRHPLNTKEKSQRKFVIHQNVKNNQEKVQSSMKLRSFSTNLQQKALTNISNIQYQKKAVRVIENNKNTTLQQKIGQLIDELKKKFIVQQNHMTSYTIKKDHFQNLLYYLAKATVAKNNQAPDDDFSCVQKYFQEIGGWISESKRQLVRYKMKIQGHLSNQAITRNEYLQQTVLKISQIEKLTHSKTILMEEVNNLQKFKKDITKQVHQKQQKITDELKIIQNNTHEINASKNELENLKKQLNFYNEEVAKIKKASAQIENYVGGQANKLIAMASQQYKNIESEIYEYASYLQCNQLASSSTYEPLSITCLTENLQEQLKNMNRTLIQNQDLSAKEKSKLMRDFLLQWMNRYKKKDDQQRDLMAFKTKCVQNFIEKMKKWLDNWTLKQDYLVNLRNQFALDTVRMNSCLAQLKSSSTCEGCSTLNHLIGNMTEIYQKIETNYKLGNSFY